MERTMVTSVAYPIILNGTLEIVAVLLDLVAVFHELQHGIRRVRLYLLDLRSELASQICNGHTHTSSISSDITQCITFIKLPDSVGLSLGAVLANITARHRRLHKPPSITEYSRSHVYLHHGLHRRWDRPRFSDVGVTGAADAGLLLVNRIAQSIASSLNRKQPAPSY